MKHTYISIPITGCNIEKQKQKAEQIKRKIPNSVSPFDIVEDSGQSYGYFMGKDIEYILDHCDTIYLCEGWKNSKGCRLEYCVALVYGLEIKEEGK